MIRDFKGVGRRGPDRNLGMPFSPMRSSKWDYKGTTERLWETDRVKMKGYTHGLVSQQRNGAGSGGREESLSFLSVPLNNNSRLNPQEFGLSPRKGMNLIIFDPFSNKRAFKL